MSIRAHSKQLRAMRENADAVVAKVFAGTTRIPKDLHGVYLGLIWRAIRYGMTMPRDQWPTVTTMSMTGADAFEAAGEGSEP